MQCGNPSETREKEIKESSGMKQITNQKLTLTKDVAQADGVAGRVAQSLGELCVFWEDSQAHPTRKSSDTLPGNAHSPCAWPKEKVTWPRRKHSS